MRRGGLDLAPSKYSSRRASIGFAAFFLLGLMGAEAPIGSQLGSNSTTRGNKKAPPELKNSRGATQRSHTTSPVHHDYLTIAIDPQAVNYRVL